MIQFEELRHVRFGPWPQEQPGGAGTVTLTARTSDPHELIARCIEVMTALLEETTQPWPSPDTWAQVLPSWFVNRCAPENTPEEHSAWHARWRGLNQDRRMIEARTRPWSLSDWLHWLEPDERTWYWWHAATDGAREARIEVTVPGWPAPLGSLEWLLKACGAEYVELPEDI